MTAVQHTLADPSVRQRLEAAGLDVAAGSTTDFGALIARDTGEWDVRVRKGLFRPA